MDFWGINMVNDLGLFGFLGILALLFGYIFQTTQSGNFLTLIGSSFMCFYSFACNTFLYSILFIVWAIVTVYNIFYENRK